MLPGGQAWALAAPAYSARRSKLALNLAAAARAARSRMLVTGNPKLGYDVGTITSLGVRPEA